MCEITRNLSDKQGIRIRCIEECFTEKIPIEKVELLDREEYDSPIATLWLDLDELKNLNKAISDYLSERQ